MYLMSKMYLIFMNSMFTIVFFIFYFKKRKQTPWKWAQRCVTVHVSLFRNIICSIM